MNGVIAGNPHPTRGSAAVTRSRDQPNAFARSLFSGLPARYDLLAELLSFGQNRRWQAAMVDVVADQRPQPALVLDVATGTGAVADRIATRTPAAVVGLDLTLPMLARASQRVGRHAGRIRLVAGQAERLPFPDASFDALTLTYLMRYVRDPAATMRELVRVVRPGGVVASLEFAVPSSTVVRALWRAYTWMVLPIAGAAAGGRAWWSVGRFLGPSITDHYRRYPLAWTATAWRQAGLEGVETRIMSLGGGVVIWGRRRDE